MNHSLTIEYGWIPVIAFISSMLLIHAILFLKAKYEIRHGEFLVLIKNFNHGERGVNNINHIIRLLNNQTKFPKNKIDESINSALNEFRYETAPKIERLLRRIPLTPWNILDVFAWAYQLEKAKYRFWWNKCLGHMNKSCNWKVKLFSKIKTYSERIKVGFYNRIKADPKETLEKIIHYFKALSLSYDINLYYHFDTKQHVLINRQDLETVLENIITNSFEAFNREQAEYNSKKVLRLSVYDNGLHTFIEIADNAGKIPEEHKGKLYMPSYSSKAEGRGYGLYEAQTLLNKYLGSLHLEQSERMELKKFIIKLKINYA